MDTQTKLAEKVDERKAMLKVVVEDVRYVEELLKTQKMKEVLYRESYHESLKAYDSITKTGRRFR